MPALGVQFPVDEKGQRSTTQVAQRIWAKAFKSVDAEGVQKLQSEKNWRKNYAKHLVSLTRASVRTPELTLQSANNGLEAVYEEFEFVTETGSRKLVEEMEQNDTLPLTGIVSSSQTTEDAAAVDGFNVQVDGKPVEGSELEAMLEEKLRNGQVEEDVVEAIRELMQRKAAWREKVKDMYFVLLGATSELCPFEKLMELGLNVVAIARPNAQRQMRLIETCRASPAGATLVLPVLGAVEDESKLKDPSFLAGVAGADVLVDTAALANWLISIVPGKQLVIGSYIYLDGGDHVRASVGMDAIIAKTIRERPGTHLMYLGTPAIVYPITREAHQDSVRRRKESPWWYSITSPTLGPYLPNVEDPVVAESVRAGAKDQSKEIFMYNGISNVQGPNYMLAKTLQNWRAMVAREQDKVRVSVNMTPVCRTDSVMHVSMVARAVHGMKAFAPLESYEPRTAKDLMALLLIYDMCSDNSAANPHVILKNPMEIFATCGVHGGLWRTPFSYESTAKTAVVLNFLHLA